MQDQQYSLKARLADNTVEVAIHNRELSTTLAAYELIETAYDAVHLDNKIPQSIRSFVYRVRMHVSDRIGVLTFAE